jgi:hypothetical protein
MARDTSPGRCFQLAGPGPGRIARVVALVLGHHDGEAGLHQRMRQVGVHERVAARSVRDRDEAAVAAHWLRIRGDLQRERAALQ